MKLESKHYKEKKPKVLIIAERANPEYKSIPLRAWCHTQAVRDLADIHVVTQHWNGNAFLRAGFKDFTGINTSLVHEPSKVAIALLRGGKGKGWTIDTALSTFEYYFFEYLVWRKFRKRIQNGEFDLVHRITPSSPTTPSLLAKAVRQAGVPFVLGPINGGLPWPSQFKEVRQQEKEWLSYFREAYQFLPGYASTRQYSNAIICGSLETLSQVPAEYRDKCIYFPANAVDQSRFSLYRQHQTKSPIKIVFVGRLVPYKGADMLIEAAAGLAKNRLLTIEIIGDGPQKQDLVKLVSHLGIQNAVNFAGLVPQAKLQEKLIAADVFAFPSIREFGGAVVMESMMVGLVPIVVDYGGPGEMVNALTGFKVPLSDRDGIVRGYRDIFQKLINSPETIDRLGKQAREHALKQFTWKLRGEQTLEVYKWVLGRKSKKPVFY